jgi:glycerol-3-phosphate dehydrogenase (NAD(P)+)
MANITILGAGAWGTALGQILAESHRHLVTIWGRDAEKIANHASLKHHHNLKDVVLSSKIIWTSDIQKALNESEVIILAIPTQYCRTVLLQYQDLIKSDIPIIQTAKGIEISTGLFTPQIVQEIFSNNPIFCLSGPGFAVDLAHLRPTALSLATHQQDKKIINFIQNLFLQTPLRPYQQNDLIGVSLGGALKNILAIAAGFCIGHNLGEGAKSAIITRGFNEMMSLAKIYKANPKTLYGLSGLGDLMLTSNSMLSRNYQYGYALGKNESLNISNSTVEGYHTLLALMKNNNLEPKDYPIFSSLNHLLCQTQSKSEIIAHLLDRPFKQEFI